MKKSLTLFKFLTSSENKLPQKCLSDKKFSDKKNIFNWKQNIGWLTLMIDAHKIIGNYLFIILIICVRSAIKGD